MSELELLESIYKAVDATAIFTGFILLIFILILVVRFTSKYELVDRGGKKK